MGILQGLERRLGGVETSLVNTALAAGALRRTVNGMWQRRHQWSTAQEDFFKQVMVVENHPDRMPLFTELCAGKDVLHVGCVDWPIFDPKNNLHLKLAPIARSLTGLDVDAAGLETLRTHYAGEYYTSVADIQRKFDVLLVPEVIEHVPNVGLFLSELDTIDFSVAMITGPNALIRPPNPWWNATYRSGESMVEFVHPDHKCYYSPYTLRNTIASLTPWNVTRIGLTTAETAVFVQAVKSGTRENSGPQ
jgi:hypothetical protein